MTTDWRLPALRLYDSSVSEVRLLARWAVAIVVSGVAMAAASRLHRANDRPYDVATIPAASVVRGISLGHATLAANVYWLKAVQYIGDPKANARGWSKLMPLVDLVTDLDPGHGYAYQVGGIILGSVGRIDESNDILEKGIRNVPDRYILPFLRAFNAFQYEGDFALAGRYVELAARARNAPAHLRATALAFYVKGREPDTAIHFLERLLVESEDPETAKAIEEQLKQAILERDALTLDEAVERYRAAYGVFPVTLDVLVAGHFVREIPPDPFGGRYIVGDDGRVRSSIHPFRFKRAGEIRKRAEPGVTPETGYPGATIK